MVRQREGEQGALSNSLKEGFRQSAPDLSVAPDMTPGRSREAYESQVTVRRRGPPETLVEHASEYDDGFVEGAHNTVSSGQPWGECVYLLQSF